MDWNNIDDMFYTFGLVFFGLPIVGYLFLAYLAWRGSEEEVEQ
jgi:hypothetical protein